MQLPRKAGLKNAQMLFGGLPPYDPSIQADQAQFARKNRAENGNTIPLGEAAQQLLDSIGNNSRIAADYTAYSFEDFSTIIFPRVLIPRNSNRSNFYVINSSAESIVWVSFGFPQGWPPAGHSPFVFGQPFPPIGFTVAPRGGVFAEENGIIGIDDIYISAFKLGANPDQFAVLGFEGVPPLGAA